MQTSTELSVIKLNQKAMQDLRFEHSSKSLFFLNEALRLAMSLNGSQEQVKLLGITYNNLGIYYQKSGDISKGLHFLNKSLEFAKGDMESLSATLLNISKLHSERGSHKESLDYGLQCIQVLRNNFEESSIKPLTVAYHNVGKEYEFLLMHSAAFDCYIKGYNLALEHFGPHDPKTIALGNSIKNLQSPKNNKPLIRARSNLKINKKVYRFMHVPNRHAKPFTLRNRTTRSGKVKRKKSLPFQKPEPKNRIELAGLLAKRNKAITIIQAWWRGVRERKLISKNVDDKLNAARKSLERIQAQIKELERLKQRIHN